MPAHFHTFPAPAKVNLFLHVTGRRADGYHLLQTVFRLLDFGDDIHIRVRQDGQIHRQQDLPGVPESQDLCIRAARLLQTHTGCPLGADIALTKRTPMGGGLGGGSSDAATVLLALNRLWQLNLDRETLMHLGLQLGADVPVFVFGENAWAEGVGDRLQPIALEPAWYLILTPQVNIPTAEVFADQELTRDTFPTTIADFSRGLVRNDLEAVVTRRYPAVAAAIEWLNQYSRMHGSQARMSGSGASVFMQVENERQAQSILAEKPETLAGLPVFACVAKGLERHPLHEFAAAV